MALKFDIPGIPPTLANITAEREQAEQELAVLRKKNKQFLIKFIIVVASMLGTTLFVLVPIVKNPDTTPTFVGIVAYFMPYMIFPVFFFGNNLHIKHIEKPRKALKAVIAGLNEVTPEDLAEVNSPGQHPAEIASYLERVAAQGRALVKGEITAIQQWLNVHKPK